MTVEAWTHDPPPQLGQRSEGGRLTVGRSSRKVLGAWAKSDQVVKRKAMVRNEARMTMTPARGKRLGRLASRMPSS